MSTLGITKHDWLPQGLDLSDDGCYVHPHCLTCPLPQCIYDDPIWWRHEQTSQTHEAIRVSKAEGMTVSQVAQRHGVSERTVFRALAGRR